MIILKYCRLHRNLLIDLKKNAFVLGITFKTVFTSKPQK